MSNAPEQLTATLLEMAADAGADQADAIAYSVDQMTVQVLKGKLEQAERAESTEIGLRVIIGKKQACIGSSDTSEATLRELAARAVAMANAAPDDPHCGLAAPDQLSKIKDAEGLELEDKGGQPKAEDLQDLALRAEAAALAVPGISQMDETSATWYRANTHLATSTGFSGGNPFTAFATNAVAITGSGTDMERDYCAEVRIHREDVPSPEEIGRLAAERTLARAGAEKPPTGQFPVLFDERVASSLIGHLGSAVNGASVARGSSWLKDALGEAVLPDGIDLVEDPHRKRTRNSEFFDAEGIPTARRKIVENGVLQGWTLDLGTARQLGMETTGNADRGPASPPRPTLGNLELTQGIATRDDLIRDMGTGLLVTSMIGSTINPTTGDYSRGAAGLWIENGQIMGPVNECTIAGNLRDMLRRIIPANDGQAHKGRIIPSLLIDGMTIAGR